MIQRVGNVVYFSPDRSFGFISSRIENTAKLEKFFFHVSRIVFSEIEVPKIPIGAYVRFYPSDQPTKRPNDSKYAIDVQVYRDENSASNAATALVAASQPGDGQ